VAAAGLRSLRISGLPLLFMESRFRARAPYQSNELPVNDGAAYPSARRAKPTMSSYAGTYPSVASTRRSGQPSESGS